MVSVQYIIVYIIVACAAAIIIRYIWQRFRGNSKGCNCSKCKECPYHKEKCHFSAHS
ncbi:MAG: FeoB-associated Cys-rich membrane protein [Bacteroidaceae bacterium]|nr:FeoB-associated Cys-rich membrane protein [Bacteroidaceae bacterium]MBR4783449.1 FeoB-associated Cys-rich membrane protein [Bacteroidaceae bacterium]